MAAGLNLDRWLNGGYDKRTTAYVVAWHRLSRMVESHANDAQIREMNRKK